MFSCITWKMDTHFGRDLEMNTFFAIFYTTENEVGHVKNAGSSIYPYFEAKLICQRLY